MASRVSLAPRFCLSIVALIGCGDQGSARDTGIAGVTSATHASTSAADETSGASRSTTTHGTTEADGGRTTGDLKFDFGAIPDAPASTPIIPETCEQASAGESSVGCQFYAVDMDTSTDLTAFAVVTANVHLEQTAQVSIQTREGGIWTDIDAPVAILPLDLHEFRLADRHQEGSGIRAQGAYRIVSDVPIVAYQFNPVDGAASFLSDASMLLPTAAWDSTNHLVNINQRASSPGAGYPYVTIVGAVDGTDVAFTAANATLAGGGLGAVAQGQTVHFTLNEGDTASLVAADQTQTLSGSQIITDSDHPVAVFPGHSCANIPSDTCCCDHLEEQLTGIHQWGRNFVAAHMPYRNAPFAPEPTFWQVYASQDNTVVTFDAAPGVTGLPAGPVTLTAGQVIEGLIGAPAGIEADFRVSADKPIALLGYMTSSETLDDFNNEIGDPAMAQFVPVEQFLPRYVLLVPGTWVNDYLVITRPAGASILVDDLALSDAEFRPVGDGTWEVARIPVPDGVHVLDGDAAAFGVVVVGYDTWDSYAYVGGAGTAIINPAG